MNPRNRPYAVYNLGLNPLRIGEGFELTTVEVTIQAGCLNPLRIGEGFELSHLEEHHAESSLNPLRIGEGFEPTELKLEALAAVLIP